MGEGCAYVITTTEPLQWGHGREAMDGRARSKARAKHGELQWGHGREAMDGGRCSASNGSSPDFNGAMAVRPWMDARRARDQRQQETSMGPWP